MFMVAEIEVALRRRPDISGNRMLLLLINNLLQNYSCISISLNRRLVYMGLTCRMGASYNNNKAFSPKQVGVG